MKCVILAGGRGDRLWPLSRQSFPKQFIKVQGNHSLFQETIARNIPFCDEFIIVTNKDYEFIVENQVASFQGLVYRYVFEEVGRKTMAAITMAVLPLSKSEMVLVIPSDQVITGNEYRDDIMHAKELAGEGYIVTCGMPIESPEERYGYIQYNGEDIVQFVEKPDYNTAIQYMKSGNYLINSGMLIFRVGDYIRELKRYSFEKLEICKTIYKSRKSRGNRVLYTEDQLLKIPCEYIEKTLLEKTNKAKVVHASFSWMDIGCLEDIRETELVSSSDGKEIVYNSYNTDIINSCPKSVVVANEVSNVVIVNTSDVVYVGRKGASENIKKYVAKDETIKPYFENGRIMYRNWGSYELLVDMPNYRVKHVIVQPGKTIFSHKHMYRSEHWSIVSGQATIEIEGVKKAYYVNDVIDIEPGMIHQVTNSGNQELIVIEVSVGEKVFEDDKVPIKDYEVFEEERENREVSIIKLQPAFKDNLWGGTRIKEIYNKKCEFDILAESWELSAHDEGQSIVVGGKYSGMQFGEYLDRIGKNNWGWKCSTFDKFPLLIKFIDAKDYLSVQVHPNDEYAMKNENQFGKNEMWYIVDCEPNSFLYCGFCKDVSKDEVKKRVANGTITEILNKIPVKKGQVYFIEAGTVHAIGAGILVCEIQQSSTCTYRLFDFDRTDKFGNKRELNIDKALDVINLKAYTSQMIIDEKEETDSFSKRVISRCKYFECLEIYVKKEYEIIGVEESFTSIICIDGRGIINSDDGQEVTISLGESIFIPKSANKYHLVGCLKIIITRV